MTEKNQTPPAPGQNQLQIDIDEGVAQGVYSNLALITHSETEMILDFMFMQPQAPRARVRSRIITSPAHAKKIMAALEDNIRKYESRFGKIEANVESPGDPKIGFYH